MLAFSDTTNKNGIIQTIEVLTGLGDGAISGNATLLAQVTAMVNNWYGIVLSDILEADGRWQFDDYNHTKEPVATFDLVANQAEYNFTFDEQSNQILRLAYVTVKDSSGNWLQLRPIDISQFQEVGISYDEYLKTAATPVFFDISDGVGVKLLPAPSYNKTAGGKVYFQREMSKFAASDTTKKPSFAGLYHIILPLGAAYDLGLAKGKSNIANLRNDLEQKRRELQDFYGNRVKFEKTTIVPKFYSPK